jgi:hypothetical protein
LAAVATWIRPDALLIFVASLVLVGGRADQGGRRRAWLVPLVGSGGLVATLFIGQRLYYGAWLPNTFALKMTGGAATLGDGLDYLARFSGRESFSLPLLCAPAVYVAWHILISRSVPRGALAVASLIYLWLSYVVWTGGDAFGYGRFCVPMIPLMALFSGALLEELMRSLRRRPVTRHVAGVPSTAALVMLLVAGLANHVRVAWPIIWAGQPPIRDNLSSACVALAIRARAFPPGRIIGVFYAGTTPYLLPEHRFHDVLGKSDPHVARLPARRGPPGHNKWDYAYSLGEIRPDLIVTAAPFDGMSDAGAAAMAGTPFHAALWVDPFFRALYRNHRLLPADDHAAWHPHWVYGQAEVSRGGPLAMPAGRCRTGPA